MRQQAKLKDRLLGNGPVRGSATALVIRLAGSVLTIAMFALAARQIDHAEFGAFAVTYNFLSFLAVVALCGQETLILRSFDEYRARAEAELIAGLLSFSLGVILTAMGVLMAVIVVVWPLWNPQASAGLVVAAMSFFVAQTLMHYSAQFARPAAGVLIGDGPREAVWRFIVVGALAIYLVAGARFSPAYFLFIAAAALAASALLQQVLVWRRIKGLVTLSRRRRDVSAWAPLSFKMWIAALLDTTSQYLEVVAIGFFVGPAAAASYFVMIRITNVFAMIAASLTSYATSRISGLYFAGRSVELQELFRSLAVIAAVLIGGAFIAVLAGGEVFLAVFGESYVSSYPTLIVLACGAAIASVAGPAAQLLLLTGHEGAYPRILAVTLAARFALIAALGPVFGLTGAVAAWSATALAMTVALIVACRRLIALDPSMLAIFRRAHPPLARLHGGLS